MKQAYIIEIDDGWLKDYTIMAIRDRAQEPTCVLPNTLNTFAEALEHAIPVSQSLLWEAKRDASLAKEQV